MSFSFTDLLSPAWVTLDLRARDAEEAVRTTVGKLAGNPAVTDADRLAAEVLEREKLSSTAAGYGVAFPHARTGLVSEIVMAVGRSREGVTFAGADGPVHFVFVIGTPPDRAAQYLAVVARLARLLKSDEVRERLLAAPDAPAFVEGLRVGG